MAKMTNRQESKTRPVNEKSILLNESENNDIFNCLGKGCLTLATGVVQLYLADPSRQQRWSKRCCGVACFVKDNPKRSYYIRVYDPKTHQLQWEQEMYHQFKYKTPREYFHTFEADDCQAALNFASEDEANKFKKVLEGKLFERHKKRLERRRPGTTSPNVAPTGPAAVKNVGSGPPPASLSVSVDKPATNTSNVSKDKSKDKKKDKKKKKLTKDEIGTPTNFKHISHVGWDPNIGLDMKKLDPEMKALFEQIGIDDQSNVDEETIDFIYDFVDKHGGVEALRKELPSKPPGNTGGPPPPPPSSNRAPTSVPSSRPPPPPPSRGGGHPPPPPPARMGGGPPPPPPGRSMGAPPPPPPSRGPAPPVRPQISSLPHPSPNASRAGVGAPPPPPPMGNIPAPPPPPPTAPAPPPPPPSGGPPPPMGGGPPLPSANPGRAGLLDQIHQGRSLKHVDAQQNSNGGDGRSDLLNQIRHGMSLKPVDNRDSDPPAQASSGGIVGALAQALAQRKTALQGSDEELDSDSSIDTDDDDDWDD